ncbi:FABP family protein [Luteococcus sp. OSA5]|uniref:FABP family protein n=1 Tax=Luteococcus sp. OSA5 TaxID=3401630 RepID=UPI003B43D56F
MAFQIPDDLNPALFPLAWMIGRWRGNGHGTWPGHGEFEYGVQIDFETNGGPYLHYVCQTYKVDAKGTPVEPISMETGFWRPSEDKKHLEVVLTAPEGWSEVWTGTIDGARIDLVTDAVMRTESAEVEYTGGSRLYGQVEGDLLWTFDRATTNHKLQPYLWARMQRVA